jgi:hypothetical protein
MLARRRQVGERLAQRRLPFSPQQLTIGRRGLLVGDAAGVQPMARRTGSACRAHDPTAFAAGGSGQPAGQRGRVADLADLVHQLQPDGLPGVVGFGAIELVPAADRPHQRGVPIYDGIPRPLVALSRAPRQVSDRHVTGDRTCLSSHDRDLLPPHQATGPACR